MKFDYCIGNPPFQQTKGQTKNIDVWPSFVKAATELADCTTMIHPGRWVIPKKQMKATNDMLIHLGLKKFDYYPNGSDIFSGVNIDGGVSITIYKKGYNGDIKYCSQGKNYGIYHQNTIFISNEYEEEILSKVKNNLGEFDSIKKRVLGNVGSLAGSEFGYSKAKHINLLMDNPKEMTDPVRIWANKGYGKGTRFNWYYIEKEKLNKIPNKLLLSRKIMLDKKGHSLTNGRGNIINNIPKIVENNAIASGDVFFVIPDHDTDYELEFIKTMFMTKTVRFLMSITQKDLYVRGFENVPDYTILMPLLNGSLPTDEWFYKYFNFSKELISHIESHVSPKCDSLKKEGN